MANVYIIWGDGVLGRLINMLPAVPGDSMRMIQPLIIELDSSYLKWLNIDQNIEGVNNFGKPGGPFIRVNCLPEDILAPIPLMDGNMLHFIVTGFNGQPSVIANYVGRIKEQNDILLREMNILKAQNKSILEMANNVANDTQTAFKIYKDTISVAKIFEEGLNTDDQDLETKGGE